MSDLTLLNVAGPVARLALNRPDARNALSIALLDSLLDAITRIPSDVTVLVLTGEGKAFCAGMDLRAVLDDPDAPPRLLARLGRFSLALRALPCVVVGRINGAAIGGGCGLACVCDFAFTHADSKMGFPEVDLGVCPAVVAPWVVRRVGPGPARRILLAGGLMSGRDAHALGLATHLVDSLDLLDAAVDALASNLARGGPHALRATKALLNELDGSTDHALIDRAADLSARVIAGPEAQARLRRTRGT